ncbi:helix-turn-helix transcriptional regulator [Clostridium sp. CCUG 7971]|uniref:helix-turn-helix domain-containing protein n=1 Tax=Clostridium sp. CCUG 7971 TaxID=2811414 RepID=UPI001ABAAFF3|nr:helix-turn-helix transcriptional regulator [Clostridium sp. CCUG 7971]MBO3446042.1 helix-turn-helix transcriptional regulator [Clostridium sp. CCUG 7971]
MKIQEKIKKNRQKNNWSQDDLAKKLNISRQAISKWETGESIPDVDKLVLMSEIFDITLDELIKGEKPKQPLIVEEKSKKGRTIGDFLYSHWWLFTGMMWYFLSILAQKWT